MLKTFFANLMHIKTFITFSNNHHFRNNMVTDRIQYYSISFYITGSSLFDPKEFSFSVLKEDLNCLLVDSLLIDNYG